jgi:hypothetical protein
MSAASLCLNLFSSGFDFIYEYNSKRQCWSAF